MAKLLYITANVKDVQDSYSLSVGEEFINEYQLLHPKDEIIRLDLFKLEIPFLDKKLIGYIFGQILSDQLDTEYKRKAQALSANLEQFISADKYVFVTPLWNYGVPPIVKAYFDNVSVAGKTFRYTEHGPVGLLPGKKALCIQAAGGIYHKGAAHGHEHGVPYIKTILEFFGIVDTQTVFIEGIMQFPEMVDKIKQEAIAEAKLIARSF